MSKKKNVRNSSSSKADSTNINAENASLSLDTFLQKWTGYTLYVLIAFIFLSFFYSDMIFHGEKPSGVDVVAGIGKVHQVKAFEKETGQTALWNPYVFGGMPIYHRLSAQIPSLDTIFNFIGRVLDYHILLFIFGSLGIIFLLQLLGVRPLIAYLAGFIFLFWPHFHALIIVGHFMKLRALMYLPWVVYFFLRFLRKTSLLNFSLFTLLFINQMRTQHYQIIFYGLLFLFFAALLHFIELIRTKNFRQISILSASAVAMLVLTIMAVSQPMLLMKEYAPHSTRGGNAVKINQNLSKADAKGVGIDYAVNWSLAPSEMLDWMVPRFHGGSSMEIYEGNIPGLESYRGKPIGNVYWGQMPFTQSYEYMGIILLILASFGLLATFKSSFVSKAISFTLVTAIFLAWGRHFLWFYKLFFYYIPYFDKFRVPMMATTLIFFLILVAAGIGLNTLLRIRDSKELQRNFYTVLGVFFMVLIGAMLYYNGTSFLSPREIGNVNQNTRIFQEIRRGIAQSGLINTFVFFFLFALSAWLYIKSKVKKSMAMVIIMLLQLMDLSPMVVRYFKAHGEFKDVSHMEQTTFAEGPLETELKKDTSLYRVFPLGQLFQNNFWSYHFRSLGGYDPAKLQIIQDVIENNLMVSIDGNIPINWNIMDISNVKYVLSQQNLNHDRLKFLLQDQSKGIWVYKYKGFHDFLFPVKNVVSKSELAISKDLNNPLFNPDSSAMIHEQVSRTVTYPDSFSYQITHFEPDHIEGTLYSDKPTFIVVSQIYYPLWHLRIDNNESLLYQTNHLVSGFFLPEGQHTFNLDFSHHTFNRAVWISGFGLGFVYLLCVFSLVQWFREDKKQHKTDEK